MGKAVRLHLTTNAFSLCSEQIQIKNTSGIFSQLDICIKTLGWKCLLNDYSSKENYFKLNEVVSVVSLKR